MDISLLRSTLFVLFFAPCFESACFDRSGEITCKYPTQICLSKKNACSQPYTDQRCKCKKAKGCRTQYNEIGCDGEHVCMRKKGKKNFVPCSGTERSSRKCKCIIYTPPGCWTKYKTQGCDYGKACVMKRRGKDVPCNNPSNKKCTCKEPPSDNEAKGCMRSDFTHGCDADKVCMRKNMNVSEVCEDETDRRCACFPGCYVVSENGSRKVAILFVRSTFFPIPGVRCNLYTCQLNPMTGGPDMVEYHRRIPLCSEFQLTFG